MLSSGGGGEVTEPVTKKVVSKPERGAARLRISSATLQYNGSKAWWQSLKVVSRKAQDKSVRKNEELAKATSNEGVDDPEPTRNQ